MNGNNAMIVPNNKHKCLKHRNCVNNYYCLNSQIDKLLFFASLMICCLTDYYFLWEYGTCFRDPNPMSINLNAYRINPYNAKLNQSLGIKLCATGKHNTQRVHKTIMADNKGHSTFSTNLIHTMVRNWEKKELTKKPHIHWYFM